MPSLQDIEKFKDVLNALGDEPEVLAEKGETLQDVPEPEEGLPPDLSELLGDMGASEDEEPSFEGLPEIDLSEDFSDVRDDADAPANEPAASGDRAESEAGAEGEPSSPESEEDDDEFVFPDEQELPDQEETPAVNDEGDADFDDLSALLGEEADDEDSGAPQIAETTSEEAELPDDLADLFGDDAAQPSAPEEPSAPPESEGATDEFSLPDDFELPDELSPEEFADAEEPQDVEPVEEAPEASEPEAAEAGDEDEFRIPSELLAPQDESGENEFGLPDEFEVPESDLAPGAEETGEVEDEFAIPDEFTFDEESGGEAPAEDLEALSPAEGEDEEEEFVIDEFSLGDLGEQFGISDDEALGEAEEEAAPASVGEELPEAEADLELSDEDFVALQRNLGQLPRNLKIAIEELIGEKDLGGRQVVDLTQMLVAGESPQALADAVSRITGKRIQIPRGYEKRTGLEFEEESKTLGYLFRRRVLPVLRVLAAGLAAVALLTFVSYRLVYTPLRAYNLYRHGYTDIQEDRYVPANEKFGRATQLWRMKPWYYRYAEGFADKRQYLLATEKYEQLLSHYPVDEKGILDYARLESEALANYEHADRLLDELLDEDMYHYEGLLASGDNYLRWAEEDPGQYEHARLAYATLLQHHGQRDEILFRMLRYFIRVDNFGEVERLKAYFQSAPEAPVHPGIYAELGGYLIDKEQLNDVQDVLFRALEEDESLPEVHYHLARYFRGVGERREEEKALNNARTFLERAAPLSKDRLAKLIDTHTRLGETYFRREEFISAEQEFKTAIDRYESALERGILGGAPEFGRAYARLGDIYYYTSGEFDAALSLYEEAEANMFRRPSLKYKKGWIRYLKGDHTAALLDFYSAGETLSSNKNVMYATANTLFMRDEYFAAQGYYNHLLSMYEQEMRTIPFLRPIEDEEHHALVVNMMKVYNNLGVTLRRLSERVGDPRKSSQGLVYLTHASDYYDNLNRDPETLERTQTVNLAYLNTREVLYPQPDFDLQIYTNIPKDPAELEF